MPSSPTTTNGTPCSTSERRIGIGSILHPDVQRWARGPVPRRRTRPDPPRRIGGPLCQTAAMADFTRTSRTIALHELDQPLLDAIRAALKRSELDIVLLDVVGVCRTESTPTKRRWIIGPRATTAHHRDRAHPHVARVGDRRKW